MTCTPNWCALLINTYTPKTSLICSDSRHKISKIFKTNEIILKIEGYSSNHYKLHGKYPFGQFYTQVESLEQLTQVK